MLFITAQQLPSFIIWDKSLTPGYNWLWLPRLKPRQVPISQYLLQVTTFASGTLLNNLVFAFSVPPTLQIVFRSAGNCPPFFFSRLSHLLFYYIIVESARAEGWIVMDRSGSIYAPRSLFHEQALHAQTNCTLPPPFSVPYNGASPRMLTIILPSFYPYIFFCGRPFPAKIAVAIVSSGVIIATLFRPRTESPITIIRDPGTATNYTSTT